MRLLLLAPLLLAGCAGGPHGTATGPRFDPLVFFDGQSRGEGTLKIAFKPASLVHVQSDGHRDGNTLVLDQRIEREGEPSRERTWTIHQVGPGRYAGTLSDAAGPVKGKLEGNRLHLSFAMKGGLKAQQWLTLAPDGQSASNRMVIRKFGATVATLDETIRRTAA